MDSLLTVCILMWRFRSPKAFENMAGAETQTLKLLRAISGQKAKRFFVVARKERDDPYIEVISQNIKIYRLPCTSISIISVVVYLLLSLVLGLYLFIARSVDVVYIPLPGMHVLSVFFLAKLFIVAVVVRIAADEFIRMKYATGRSRISRYMLRSLILQADALQSLTPYMYNMLSNYMASEKLIHFIPNGVFIPNCSRDYENLTMNLTYIGAMRFSPSKQKIEQKNLKFLLEAFAAIGSKPELKLIMVGNGNYRSELEEYTKELDISNKVKFVGYQEEIQSYFLSTDIFVNPSHHEGMPNTVLEAMSYGVYALCSDIRVHRYLLGVNRFGDVFDHHSKRAFVIRVEQFYEHTRKYIAKAAKARKRIIESFSINKTANRVLAMLKQTAI